MYRTKQKVMLLLLIFALLCPLLAGCVEDYIYLVPSVEQAVVGEPIVFQVHSVSSRADGVEFTISDPSYFRDVETSGTTMCATPIKAGKVTVTATEIRSRGEAKRCDYELTIHPQAVTVSVADPQISILGRTEATADGKGLLLANTAAGIEFAFFGAEVSIQMNLVSGTYASFALFLDGETDPTANVIELSAGVNTYTLATFEQPGRHTIRMQKITEDALGQVAVDSLEIKRGGLLPLEKDRYHSPIKIEVYGTSITTGYGNMSQPGETVGPHHQNGLMTYAAIAARMLNADMRVFAQSEISFAWESVGVHPLATLCTRVSPTSTAEYDMEQFVPDAIVIYVEPENLVYTDAPFDDSNALTYYAYDELLFVLSEKYGDPRPIFLCYGMGDGPSEAIITEIASGDTDHLYLVRLPASEHEYPCAQEHQKAAEILAKAIEDVLKQR